MDTKDTIDLEQLKYPVGKFVRGTKAESPERIAACISVITTFPKNLHDAVSDLTDAQLDTPYRPGGWTIRQLVHHVADSHSQSLHRFKLALTEDKPVIKPYNEALWAEHVDARTLPLDASFGIIAGTHARWVSLMQHMNATDFARVFVHPEQDREISLSEALELYVWHSTHHLAHITKWREREGI